jgi:hypothetical protein
MDITLDDLRRFQTEAGSSYMDLLMRAITAERQVRELTASLEKATPAEETTPDDNKRED